MLDKESQLHECLIDHFVVGVRGRSEVGEGGGPVEEREGLEERYAMTDPTASVDDMADEGRRDGMDCGDSGEVEGQRWDGVARGRRGGVWVWVWVFAVVVFD